MPGTAVGALSGARKTGRKATPLLHCTWIRRCTGRCRKDDSATAADRPAPHL